MAAVITKSTIQDMTNGDYGRMDLQVNSPLLPSKYFTEFHLIRNRVLLLLAVGEMYLQGPSHCWRLQKGGSKDKYQY
jgi:hypothetical protein